MRATEPIVIDLEPKVTIARHNLVFKVVFKLDGERRNECEVPELHSRVNCKAAMSAAELHAILAELEEDN